MSKQEIENYNRLCTEFLGYKLHFIDEEKTQPYLIHNDKYKVTGGTILLYKGAELKFHSDWNWIMDVLSKIEESYHTIISQGITGHYVNINREDVNILTQTLDNPSKFMGVGKTKKEAVVQAINQFLIWYEQNKII